MHVSKIYLFWRRAALLMQAAPSIRHVAKVDDDCFLHLPNVEADLARLACVPDLAYGKVAWISLRQAPLAVCGFSWAAHHLPYQRRGCGRLGFGEPFPFVVGILELLSSSLVRHVGTSAEVARSYALASGPDAISTGTTEDPLVGSWVAGATRSRRSLSFVKVGTFYPVLRDQATADSHPLPTRKDPRRAPATPQPLTAPRAPGGYAHQRPQLRPPQRRSYQPGGATVRAPLCLRPLAAQNINLARASPVSHCPSIAHGHGISGLRLHPPHRHASVHP